jgi:hypothetical protein
MSRWRANMRHEGIAASGVWPFKAKDELRRGILNSGLRENHAVSNTPSFIHADLLRYIQALAQSAPNSCRYGLPSPLLGFCIAAYKPVALFFSFPSGPLSFFGFPCPLYRGG